MGVLEDRAAKRRKAPDESVKPAIISGLNGPEIVADTRRSGKKYFIYLIIIFLILLALSREYNIDVSVQYPELNRFFNYVELMKKIDDKQNENMGVKAVIL